jgi:hypothetical protein
MRLRHHYAIMVVGAVVTGVILVWSRPVEREPHLPTVERLSDGARAAVRTQMHSHARAMMALVSTVTTLDYEAAAAAATELLTEPTLARPLTGDASELNAALPPRFFALQDQLRGQLAGIAAAARARQPDELASAFAATVQTCVHCHDAYLRGR